MPNETEIRYNELRDELLDLIVESKDPGNLASELTHKILGLQWELESLEEKHSIYVQRYNNLAKHVDEMGFHIFQAPAQKQGMDTWTKMHLFKK